MLEVMGRHTEEKMNYDLTPPVQWTYSILTAALLDGDRSSPLKAETSAIIKSWSTAADILVTQVFGYVDENQHTLLRRRADWPAIGIEFEELTKERKKQFGVKDGKVVVTAVAPGGAGEKAGLRPGNVITTVDGEKLKDPVKLARAIYARGPRHVRARRDQRRFHPHGLAGGAVGSGRRNTAGNELLQKLLEARGLRESAGKSADFVVAGGIRWPIPGR